MIRVACDNDTASCLIASIITETATPCPCEGGPLRICGTGMEGQRVEVRVMGDGVYEIDGVEPEQLAAIRARRCPL